MKKLIFGFDLGVTSIGWAVVKSTENTQTITDMGTRIIPLSTDDKEEFTKGNAISKNQKRTLKRTQRKGYKRYQLRRQTLINTLEANNMMPSAEQFALGSLELFGLREKALKEKLSLQELGRIFYHLNQKRGYKSSRSDANLDKKDTEYVAAVKGRHQHIADLGITIGQYFYNHLLTDKYYRIKEQVFPREAYIEEFDAICNAQKKYHPALTESLIEKLRNEIIYFQRGLKSQKGLVSICELEGRDITTDEGKTMFAGPRVAPKTSPLFQLCKIWETVNNITLKIRNNAGSKYKWADYALCLEEKKKIADYLNKNAKLTYAELLRILNLKKDDVYANKQIQKDLQGNITFAAIAAIINDEALLKFEPIINNTEGNAYLLDKKTGEILEERPKLAIDKLVEREPLYQLWHTIYSIKDTEECKKALVKRFSIPERTAAKLAQLDFNKQSFGDKSNKAMRKILPYLMQGFNYAHACSFAGYQHSKSLTKDEIENLTTEDRLILLQKNSLRQPVVEKILNQMINLVNALLAKHGKPDEIRVELARELKQNKDERNEADKQNTLNKKLHDEISLRLVELGLPTTKRNIQKYKFIFPVREKKWNEAQVLNQCIYCGASFNLSDAISGNDFDVDHIVPKSLLFDDSQTNKVLVHRKCNANKTNTTAYDYIASKGEDALQDYLERVDTWFKQGVISYGKMNRLKLSYNEYKERKKLKKETEADKKIWESFIDRQLRETAYISRKAKQLLQKVCAHVYATEGTVTANLRNLWGWNEVLPGLQLPKYQALNLTETKEWTSSHGKHAHQREKIVNWDKRKDHRHHAIDALVVACTKQGYIQRMNTLNASEVRDEMKKELGTNEENTSDRLTLLDRYLQAQQPFTAKEVSHAVSKILVSFKPGKKVATISKLKAMGKNETKGVITPRGALSEESVYGKILSTEAKKPVKYLFDHPHLIFKPHIKQLVEARIGAHEGDVKKALASLKKEPIFLDKEKTKPLEFGTCFKEEVVIKYPITGIKAKDVDSIIDTKVRAIVKERLELYNNKEKEAFKDLENNPVWYNEALKIPIKTVRCFTGLSAVEPLKKDANGKEIAFVKPGNNHHIAIYIDQSGKKQEHVCTFWHAVERRKYGIPVVISNAAEVWDKILTENRQLPQAFLEKLPPDGWQLQLSMQQNEMFILGMNKEAFEDAMRKKDYKKLSEHLYRAQKLSSMYYVFRHHLETELDDSKEAQVAKRFYSIRSIGALENENPNKVHVTNIGEIRFP